MSLSSKESDTHSEVSCPSGEASASWPLVSVIAPMYNEERFLPQFVESMLVQEYPVDRFEVLLIDGRSQDRTLELAQDIVREHSNFRLLDNPHRSLPHGSNIGIRNARGAVIARADIHAEYPPDYLHSCVEALARHEAWCVGGILCTEAGASTTTARAIAIVQSHPFGVGNSQARVGKELRIVDSVAFPCMWRSVLEQVGLYNELMPRHEDVELYARIRRAGGTLMIVPSIRATYYARSSIYGLLKQAWQNGYETPIACVTDSSCTRLRHWVPGLFVGSLALLSIAAPFSQIAMWLLIAELGAYLLPLLFTAVDVGRQHGWRLSPTVALTCTLHHLAYGMGTVSGVLTLPRHYLRAKRYRFPVLHENAPPK